VRRYCGKVFANFLALFFLLSLTGCPFTIVVKPIADGNPPPVGGGGGTVVPVPGDPFFIHAWFLNNTGQTAFAASGGTPGVDMNLVDTIAAGYRGTGIVVRVSDSGVESGHEDLSANFIFGRSSDYRTAPPYRSLSAEPGTPNDSHGTPVAGLIGAVGWNGKGSRGVAPGVGIVSANYIGDGISQTVGTLLDQAEGDVDIVNQSWGAKFGHVQVDAPPEYYSQLKLAVETGRSGRGTIFVKSAGNNFETEVEGVLRPTNSNFDEYGATPFTIVAAALSANGLSAYYSSPGSNIWISSFGGSNGVTLPAMVSTDLSGCVYGLATTGGGNAFEAGGVGNGDCSYTTRFNGTSSAAPLVSGAVALMLEANPSLSWRDVKHILAVTAKRVAPRAGSEENPFKASPGGHTWEQGWVTNSVGYDFHNWFGFGGVDVDSAVAMAKVYDSGWGPQQTLTYPDDSTPLYWDVPGNLPIPDDSAAGVTSTIEVFHNYTIEAVQVGVLVTHGFVGDVGFEITSPAGTRSIVLNVNNALYDQDDYLGVLLTNAFYGENSAGTWTLKVLDGDFLLTGTFDLWAIDIFGRPDDPDIEVSLLEITAPPEGADVGVLFLLEGTCDFEIESVFILADGIYGWPNELKLLDCTGGGTFSETITSASSITVLQPDRGGNLRTDTVGLNIGP